MNKMKCSIESCNRPVHARGLCGAHYQRNRLSSKGIDPQRPVGARSGKYSATWKGGTFRTVDGRVLIMDVTHPHPDYLKKYVFRYRSVMEKHIGRYLERSEIIHHKNGIVDDDRIENLEITNRADHINHHRKELTEARLAMYARRKSQLEPEV
jgi:uncharacterized protein (DUF1330 family)